MQDTNAEIETRLGVRSLAILRLLALCFFAQGCDESPTGEESPTGVISGGGTWTRHEAGVSGVLYDIDFADRENGWIVGDSAIILRSSDGGESWHRQTSPPYSLLSAVDFVDNSNGWICGGHSIIRTRDGGQRWEEVYHEDLGEGSFRDVQFLNRNTGFAVGGRGSFGSSAVLAKTEDGGDTWQYAPLSGLHTLTRISIVDERSIWACGFDGTVLTSADIGNTWEVNHLSVNPAPNLTTIQFVDQNNGWVSSRDDWLGFYRTTDGGKTWIQRSRESLSVFGVQTFFFADSLDGWLATFPGGGPPTITQTTNGGSTWEYLQQDLDVLRIHSLFFADNSCGWGVGIDRTLNPVVLLYRPNK